MDSERLILVNCTPAILKAAIAGNEQLTSLLFIQVPDKWTEFGTAVFHYSLQKLEEQPDSQPWWTYLIVHKGDHKLIGTCGYKGPPKEGIVDIGYEIIPAYRGQGLATEAADLLLRNAFQNTLVQKVQAHTLVGPNASTRVLEKLGFGFVRDLDSPDGRIWEWIFPART